MFQAVMIGDDIVTDVGGAQACGIRGIQVRTGKYRLALLMKVVQLLSLLAWRLSWEFAKIHVNNNNNNTVVVIVFVIVEKIIPFAELLRLWETSRLCAVKQLLKSYVFKHELNLESPSLNRMSPGSNL